MWNQYNQKTKRANIFQVIDIGKCIRTRRTDNQNELRERQWLWAWQRQKLRWRWKQRFHRGSPAPKPVEVGKEYEVNITEISRQGDSITRVQGFVKNGKVKQNVKIKVEQVGNRFATAALIEQIYNDSPSYRDVINEISRIFFIVIHLGGLAENNSISYRGLYPQR